MNRCMHLSQFFFHFFFAWSSAFTRSSPSTLNYLTKKKSATSTNALHAMRCAIWFVTFSPMCPPCSFELRCLFHLTRPIVHSFDRLVSVHFEIHTHSTQTTDHRALRRWSIVGHKWWFSARLYSNYMLRDAIWRRCIGMCNWQRRKFSHSVAVAVAATTAPAAAAAVVAMLVNLIVITLVRAVNTMLWLCCCYCNVCLCVWCCFCSPLFIWLSNGATTSCLNLTYTKNMCNINTQSRRLSPIGNRRIYPEHSHSHTLTCTLQHSTLLSFVVSAEQLFLSNAWQQWRVVGVCGVRGVCVCVWESPLTRFSIVQLHLPFI